MRQISCIDPLTPALARTRTILFRPFDIGKWLTLGFTAWLAVLGQSGGSLNLDLLAGEKNEGPIREFVRSHWAMIASLAVILIAILLIVLVAVVWIQSRGTFMFLDNVVGNRDRVSVPWHRYRAEANSFFRWSLAYAGISLIVLAIFTLVPLVAIISLVVHGAGVLAAIPVVAYFMMILLLVIVSLYIWIWFTDFASLLMYKDGIHASQAWPHVVHLFRQYPGAFILYGMMKVVLAIGLMFAALIFGLMTCCCGFALMIIPYVGTVLFLPYYVFMRCYAIEFLRQFGPEYDVYYA